VNILIVFSQPWKVGGAETHVTDLIKGLKANGHNVYLAVHGEISEKMNQLVDGQWSFNFRSKKILEYPLLANQLVKLVKEKQIDILHCHQRTAGYLAAYIKKRTAVPFVVTIHDPWNRALFKNFHGKIFDHIITVSEFLRKRFIGDFGFEPEKVHTIYNGADSERYDPIKYCKGELDELKKELGINSGDKVISLIARLYTSKGQQYLIEAVPAILEKCPATKILLVGSGEHEVQFKTQAMEIGVSESVIFVGYREDIPELIGLSDIVVRPSDMEGFPINMLEAMLMKKPVIATAIAGVPEMITHGENGFMIKPGDVQALANYSIELLLDEKKAELMGNKGRAVTLQKFTLHSLIKSVESLYLDLVRKDISHG